MLLPEGFTLEDTPLSDDIERNEERIYLTLTHDVTGFSSSGYDIYYKREELVNRLWKRLNNLLEEFANLRYDNDYQSSDEFKDEE